MKGNQKGVLNERRRQSLRIQKPDSIAKRPEPRTAVIIHQTTRSWGVISLWIITSMTERRSPSAMCSRRCCLCHRVINSVLVPTIGEQIMLARIIDEEREYDREEKEADDNAQQEDEKEKENSEADEKDKEESESETDELKQLKEICRVQADKLWKEIEAEEEEVGGKQDEEEGEEKEAETSDEEKENSEDDEKVEEKVVESEAEGEDDQAEVDGKEDQEEEVEGKESETREQDKEKSETDEVESEAREAEIE
ncbi:unnamed protein product, partial [Brassica oleracea]